MAKITRSRVTADDWKPGEDLAKGLDMSPTMADGNDDEIEDIHHHNAEVMHKRSKINEARKAVSSGWGAAPEERKEVVKSDNLILKDKGKRIVKLLDNEPPVKYKRHYVNSKKRYYTCTQNECPLCEVGVRASLTFMMNVVDLTDDPSKVLTYTFGTEVATQLQSLADDGDLNDINRYFQVYHEKIANREAPATRVQKLKARDLEEDYGILPLNEEEIAELETECFGPETVYESTNSYLQSIADEVLPGDLPQKRTR